MVKIYKHLYIHYESNPIQSCVQYIHGLDLKLAQGSKMLRHAVM